MLPLYLYRPFSAYVEEKFLKKREMELRRNMV